MLIVIADDITGAAEIAGIAKRYGLKSALTTSVPSDCEGTDVLVIATDARSYGPKDAYDITADIARHISPLLGEHGGLQKPSPLLDFPFGRRPLVGRGRGRLFRKTDSALRGNVREELQAILDNTPYEKAIYMPANPSKGRIIRDGVYYIQQRDETGNVIKETPISETDFKFDPEFPAFSSRVEERLPGISYANAETQKDVEAVVNSADSKTLLAGAADLFEALLSPPSSPPSPRRGSSERYSIDNAEKSEQAKVSTKTPPSGVWGAALGAAGEVLIVRGSTLSRAIPLDIPTEVMPRDVFYEESKPCTWAASIIERYRREGSVILSIGDKEVRSGKHAAVYLREAMAEVCLTLLDARQPKELIIEGGATAFAILSKLPWHEFEITDEFAPGVVRMKPRGEDIHITMKPGSYPW